MIMPPCLGLASGSPSSRLGLVFVPPPTDVEERNGLCPGLAGEGDPG